MEDKNIDNKDNKTQYPSSIRDFFWELIKIVVISLVIIIPVRYFLIQPFYVKGASMEPNFYDHEYLIINEIDYRLSQPERGEIIVFKYPLDPSQYFIKRIIALPKERVKIEKGEVKIFNEKYPQGLTVDESEYLFPGTKTPGIIDLTLGDNEYFVLGDNRNSSLDSRAFGLVPKKNIVGKVWVRGWPLNRMTHFVNPFYGF